MDLERIEKQAMNIKSYSEQLINQYRSIVSSLNRVYGIVVRQDSDMARILNGLIERYNDMIAIVSNTYISSADRILEYVDNSNRSLNELSINIANSVKIFNDMLASLELFGKRY